MNNNDEYSLKPKNTWSIIRPVDYLLREQRLLLILIGIAIALNLFILQTGFWVSNVNESGRFVPNKSHQVVYETPVSWCAQYHSGSMVNSRDKVLLGLKRKSLRVVVTGGADRLMARGDNVIIVDNFFTERKENVLHLFWNLRFERIRYDVMEPLWLEVDQIYHLACLVHYKYNLVKTIKTNDVGILNISRLAKRVAANVEVWIARIFNTCGPRMCRDDGHVASNFISQVVHKELLTVFVNGKQTRSLHFVSDLVEGLMRLMAGEHVGPFNLGNSMEFIMLELEQIEEGKDDSNNDWDIPLLMEENNEEDEEQEQKQEEEVT